MTMNNELYQASLEALSNHGCPQDIAEKASVIVASDNPELPNWGRTTEDQEIINQAVTYLNGGEPQ